MNLTAAQHLATPLDGRVWPALLLGISTAAGGYWLSLRLHPYRRCRRCRGSGRLHGNVFTGAFRDCRQCGGTGKVLRRLARTG